jgi:hypothetical protein
MIPNNILIDLFLYFARFPKQEGILPLFNLGESTVSGYTELLQAVQSLDEHSLTGIENYVFGANIDAIKTRVNNIPAGSNYLFVDFGEIDCDTDSRNRMIDSARLAITVGYRVKSFSADLIEQTLAFSHTFNDMVAIRNKMITEQRDHPWLKNISNNHTFVPFVSPEMSSIGWTILFNREAYDSFEAKK